MSSTTASALSENTPLPALPQPFPFVALVGQDALQQALLLVAVDAGLGGVLIAGPRGTAKSTSARALAALLAPAPFVTLPLGASEAQLIGSLDLDAVLRDGTARFAPGMLAKAHGGVLYVDEVNLLPDALADALLDAAASGINVVERDGVSHRHAARFMLIGTMNEEEGELRPQLSDRFGLSVVLENYRDVALREAIVRSRLAFDLDPEAFVASHAASTLALRQKIEAARLRLSALAFSDAVHRRVSEWCLAAAVDGVRADLVMLKAARAQAALDGAESISVAHVDRVAPLVLSHRRQAGASPSPSGGEQASMPTEQSSAKGQDSNQPARNGVDAPSAAETRKGHGEMMSRGQADGRASAAPDGDPSKDWGYLAPAQTAVPHVKHVRPYDAKKA
ncbi:AAA family ATPase [Robbsia sp. KACC 23696]|uniref:ATP-binding protein n=1 Tax=Robbsia sp. KACC 23696 TaxID=3149231 RepID=UPI00325A6BF2